VEKLKGKRQLERPRLRCVDNIRVDSWRDGMERCGLDWSRPGQEQVESSCEFGIEPSGSIKCLETNEWSNNC
jgi:hypothetical protein